MDSRHRGNSIQPSTAAIRLQAVVRGFLVRRRLVRYRRLFPSEAAFREEFARICGWSDGCADLGEIRLVGVAAVHRHKELTLPSRCYSGNVYYIFR